jgi:phosphatidylinositol alpha-1,6-mannosyltransferase
MQYGPFDAIFCGHLYHMPLAAFIGRIADVPLWLQTHGVDAWGRPDPIVRYAAEHSKLITTVSRHTKGKLLAWANIEPERVRVLPNTFRPMFSTGPVDQRFMEQLGLTGRKVILTVSRLSNADFYKGHHRIIRIMPSILKLHPDARYVIVGDGDARAELQQDAARRGLSSVVLFLGGLSDTDVLRLYRSSRVFAMPSTKEGFGIVFLEAAATGLPVIGGNRDGSADALADGSIGRMIDPEDEDALTQSLLSALAGSAKADANSVGRFAFENFARHVDDLVQRLAC